MKLIMLWRNEWMDGNRKRAASSFFPCFCTLIFICICFYVNICICIWNVVNEWMDGYRKRSACSLLIGGAPMPRHTPDYDLNQTLYTIDLFVFCCTYNCICICITILLCHIIHCSHFIGLYFIGICICICTCVCVLSSCITSYTWW